MLESGWLYSVPWKIEKNIKEAKNIKYDFIKKKKKRRKFSDVMSQSDTVGGKRVKGLWSLRLDKTISYEIYINFGNKFIDVCKFVAHFWCHKICVV